MTYYNYYRVCVETIFTIIIHFAEMNVDQNDSRDSFRPIIGFVTVQETPLLWKPL